MISGSTILKNAEKLGYPWKESLKSLAPYCHEIVVALGDCQDQTAASLDELKTQISCPLRIIDSPWSSENTHRGTELAFQTNRALAECRHDVCFYLQADEVLHEKDFQILQRDLKLFSQDESVSALVLSWVHFYADYDHWVESRAWYRREIRVIKKSHHVWSHRDAQGFRRWTSEREQNKDVAPSRDDLKKKGWKKIPAALSQAKVHHYGWVRPAPTMAEKSIHLDRLWHGKTRDEWHLAETVYQPQWGLKKYGGTHPQVMIQKVREFEHWSHSHPDIAILHERIVKKSKALEFQLRHWKLWMSWICEQFLGFRWGEFKNYSALKEYLH